jgi:hypothetical protein
MKERINDRTKVALKLSQISDFSDLFLAMDFSIHDVNVSCKLY